MYKSILAALSILLFAGAAVANDDVAPNYAATGYYLQLGGLFSADGTFDNEGDEGLDLTGGGVTASVGVRPISWLAVDLTVNWAEPSDGESAYGTMVEIQNERTSTVVSAKVYPFAGFTTSRVQPYLRAGAGYLDVETTIDVNTNYGYGEDYSYTLGLSADGGTINLGVGSDFYLTECLYAFLDYGYSQGVTADVVGFSAHEVGAGLGIRF